MTPKEKAKELIDLFFYSCRECDAFFNAYKSALTHVEELIKIVECVNTNEIECDVKYWNKVKKELKKYDI